MVPVFRARYFACIHPIAHTYFRYTCTYTHSAHTYSNIDLINSSTCLKCLSIGHLSCHCPHPVGLIYGILLLLLLRLQQATQRCSTSVCKKENSLKDGLIPRPFGTRLTEREASVFLGRLRKPSLHLLLSCNNTNPISTIAWSLLIVPLLSIYNALPATSHRRC